MQFPNKETRAPRPGPADRGSQWQSSRAGRLCWRQDLRDGDSHQSFPASHTGKDSCSQLQLLYKQHRSEEKRGREKGKEMDGGEAGGNRPPLSTFYLSRGCNAGKLDQPPPERQTRVISSLINSGSQLLCAPIYLQTIPVSRGSADRVGFPGKGWGKGSSEGWLPSPACGFESLS